MMLRVRQSALVCVFRPIRHRRSLFLDGLKFGDFIVGECHSDTAIADAAQEIRTPTCGDVSDVVRQQ
jgi:hypothetical protein